MGENSTIGWTHHTFNPWIGCAKVSAGCKNCYASVATFTNYQRSRGLELWGEDAARHVTAEANWRKPITWNRAAEKAGERHRVFCASMADVFEDRRDLDEQRERLWKLIEATPNLDWLLLTKRPQNMIKLAPAGWASAWPHNVWAGTTTEDQQRFDERIEHILNVPAATRFLSMEPLLGPIVVHPGLLGCVGHLAETFGNPLIHWVIVGGESGPGRRELDLSWLRSIVESAKAAGAAVYTKQDSGPRSEMRGRIPDELWLKEYPR